MNDRFCFPKKNFFLTVFVILIVGILFFSNKFIQPTGYKTKAASAFPYFQISFNKDLVAIYSKSYIKFQVNQNGCYVNYAPFSVLAGLSFSSWQDPVKIAIPAPYLCQEGQSYGCSLTYTDLNNKVYAIAIGQCQLNQSTNFSPGPSPTISKALPTPTVALSKTPTPKFNSYTLKIKTSVLDSYNYGQFTFELKPLKNNIDNICSVKKIINRGTNDGPYYYSSITVPSSCQSSCYLYGVGNPQPLLNNNYCSGTWLIDKPVYQFEDWCRSVQGYSCNGYWFWADKFSQCKNLVGAYSRITTDQQSDIVTENSKDPYKQYGQVCCNQRCAPNYNDCPSGMTTFEKREDCESKYKYCKSCFQFDNLNLTDDQKTFKKLWYRSLF